MPKRLLGQAALGLDPLLIHPFVESALLEDLGRRGDITSQAILPPSTRAQAALVTREPGAIAGLEVARAVFRMVDPQVLFQPLVSDGALCAAQTVLARVEGPARGLLTAERVALNFLSHLSGIASQTSRCVTAVSHTKAQILDTRKTTPNLRILEKYAVVCGGGCNHRFGLDDAILIKDNHIMIAGGVTRALQAVKAVLGPRIKIEIEVDTLEQLEEVIQEGADIVLLDNMQPETLTEAVRRVAGRLQTEASGGVRLENVRKIAETGVDFISIGGLTHSAPALDIGLDITVTR